MNFKLKRDPPGHGRAWSTPTVTKSAMLADDRRIAAYTPTRFPWDGRTDDGTRAPDGTYRIRLTLREEGRSVRS